jgi:4-amino-4-deoxy-L-arabinose transferase-like glycosyltransferase
LTGGGVEQGGDQWRQTPLTTPVPASRGASVADQVGLVCLALLARFSTLPYWRHLPLGGDEGYYWQNAVTIASGRLTPDFLRPPLWSYVLAVAAKVSSDPVSGRILSTLVGAAAVPLIYSLGCAFFDRRVGVIAGLISAVFPSYLGYSHYLWAETFFSAIALLLTHCFLRQLRDPSERALYLCFLATGLALLAKEGAVLVVCAFVSTLLWCRIRVRKRVLLVGGGFFLAPVLIYSTWATCTTRRLIVLADAPLYNTNQVKHGRAPWQLTPTENKKLLLDDLTAGRLWSVPASAVDQLGNLWTPNSFPVHRLLHATDFGNYNAPHAAVLAYGAVGAYIVVMVAGLTGLVFSEHSPFKVYSAFLLFLLSASSALFSMCSRFRVPFVFPLILYSAYLIAHPAAVWGRFTDKVLLRLWIGFMALFLTIVVAQWPTIGDWG